MNGVETCSPQVGMEKEGTCEGRIAESSREYIQLATELTAEGDFIGAALDRSRLGVHAVELYKVEPLHEGQPWLKLHVRSRYIEDLPLPTNLELKLNHRGEMNCLYFLKGKKRGQRGTWKTPRDVRRGRVADQLEWVTDVLKLARDQRDAA